MIIIFNIDVLFSAIIKTTLYRKDNFLSFGWLNAMLFIHNKKICDSITLILLIDLAIVCPVPHIDFNILVNNF